MPTSTALTSLWDGLALTAPTPWEAALWSQRGQITRMDRAAHYLDLTPGDNLLDFGCGTGFYTNWIPQGANYVGVDSSMAMVERATREHPGYAFMDSRFMRMQPLDYTHILVMGTLNMESDFTMQRAINKLQELWDLEPKVLVASLYHGTDERNLQFDPSFLATMADGIASQWIVDHYLPNDLMLVLRK